MGKGSRGATSTHIAQARARGKAAAAPSTPGSRGAGSAATAVQVHSPAAQATLARVEREFIGRRTERLIALDPKTGAVRLDLEGHETGVEIPVRLQRRLDYAILTHPHPRWVGAEAGGGLSLSETDVELAASYRARAIRAVTYDERNRPEDIYEMRPNPDARPGRRGWSEKVWLEEIKPAYHQALRSIRPALRKEIAARMRAGERLDPRTFSVELYHRAWTRVAAESGGRLIYTRTPWEAVYGKTKRNR